MYFNEGSFLLSDRFRGVSLCLDQLAPLFLVLWHAYPKAGVGGVWQEGVGFIVSSLRTCPQ